MSGLYLDLKMKDGKSIQLCGLALLLLQVKHGNTFTVSTVIENEDLTNDK